MVLLNLNVFTEGFSGVCFHSFSEKYLDNYQTLKRIYHGLCNLVNVKWVADCKVACVI